MKTKTPKSDGAVPDAVRQTIDEEPEGDIEHDEQAFYNYLARTKRGSMPGFAPAGIKGTDSDLEVMEKWNAYMRSPKFPGPKGLPPQRVLMALIRQDGGDQELEAQGFTSDLIAEFNHGHLTKRMLLTKPEPRTPEEHATWWKLSLSGVRKLDALKVRTGEKHVEKEKAQVWVFVFAIENRSIKTAASVSGGELYAAFKGFKLRPPPWWMGSCQVFALEVLGLIEKDQYTKLTAVKIVEPSRQLYYVRDQMSDLIKKAYEEAKKK